MSIEECNYCLNELTIENYPITLKCGHSICIQCIQFLRNNNIYYCPWDKILDDRNINIIPKYKEICRHLDKKKTLCGEHNLPFLYFSLKTLEKKCKACVKNKKITNYKEINEKNNYIKDQLSKLFNAKAQIFKIFTERLAILNGMKEFNKKIKDANQIQINIDKINFCESLKEKIDMMNKLNIFNYNESAQSKNTIKINQELLEYTYFRNISNSAINCEHKLIKRNSRKRIWLSRQIRKLMIVNGRTRINLMIESSKKIIIKGFGLGKSTTESSFLVLNSIEIIDQEGNYAFFRSFDIVIEKQDSRLIYEIYLEQDEITLISGKTYAIFTTYNGIDIYVSELQKLNFTYHDYKINIVGGEIRNPSHIFYIIFG